MNLKQYRAVFLVITVALTIFAAYPMLAVVVNLPDTSEKFSEIWLLDQEHTTAGYPFNVTTEETYRIFAALGNQMGSSEYYRVYMKFGNTTQILLNESSPISLPPLSEFRALVGDEASWESPVDFEFQNTVITNYTLWEAANFTRIVFNENTTMSVENIVINGAVFPVNVATRYDFGNRGFYFRLAFELWHYDIAKGDFSFQDSIVGLRFNMTVPQQQMEIFVPAL